MKKISITIENIRAVKRVLKLVDGYMSRQIQNDLIGYDGGIMTLAELREHVKAANKLLPTKTTK